VRIDHVDSLRPGMTGTVTMAESTMAYQTWADLLTSEGAEVLGRYQTEAYAGTAAVTQNAYGRGRCIVVGPWGTEAFHRHLFKRLLEQAGLTWLELPEGVRLNRLRRQGILLNFNAEAVATGHLQLGSDENTIAAHDVVFLRQRLP
jgi:beta-galactosidase GanA